MTDRTPETFDSEDNSPDQKTDESPSGPAEVLLDPTKVTDPITGEERPGSEVWGDAFAPNPDDSPAP